MNFQIDILHWKLPLYVPKRYEPTKTRKWQIYLDLSSILYSFIQIPWILFFKHVILLGPPVVKKNFIFQIFSESLKSMVLSLIPSLENKIWDSLLFWVKSVEIKILKIVKNVFLEKLFYTINIKHET